MEDKVDSEIPQDFRLLKKNKKGEYIFYTCPSKSSCWEYKDDYLKHLRSSLQQIYPQKWQWIIDCEGLTVYHVTQFSLIRQIINIIRYDFEDSLNGVHIVNHVRLIDGAIAFARPFMSEKAQSMIHIVHR